jgi:hypothetical protein
MLAALPRCLTTESFEVSALGHKPKAGVNVIELRIGAV